MIQIISTCTRHRGAAFFESVSVAAAWEANRYLLIKQDLKYECT
jgi:hypothetical protein